MVDSYATTLGSLTLAVHADGFLLEDAETDCVLTLQPAVTLASGGRILACEEVEEFATSDSHLEVRWKARAGLRVRSALRLLGQGRLRLETTLENVGDGPAELRAVHPLHFTAGGPGACALGVDAPRTLGLVNETPVPQLLEAQGGEMRNDWYGAWFGRAGRPTILAAALQAPQRPPRLRWLAVRGRILALRIDCLPDKQRLEPGERIQTPDFLLAIGDLDIREELQAWAEGLNDPRGREAAPQFDPGGQAAVLEQRAEQEALEIDLDPEPVLPKEPPQVAETVFSAPEGATDFSPFRRRTAFFRRALRASDGVWPRWATGRRYAPLSGFAARSKHHRIIEY